MGPGKQSEILTGSTLWQNENINLNYLSGTQDTKTFVYLYVYVCVNSLFTLFWMDYKSKTFVSEPCRGAHEDLIR